MTASLRARLAALHSNHRRIAAGALLIGVLTLIAKLFVATREMAIAWRYGVSGTVDAYQLAVTATTWVPMMLAGVMTVVLVPRLVSLQRQGGDRRGFVAELNGTVLILGGTVAALTWLAAPAAATLLASRADPGTARLTVEMTEQMAPVALFLIASAYLSARLQARERYAYSVTEALPALVIALFVLVPSGLVGARPLIAGTLLGYLIQLFVLGGLARRGDAPLGMVKVRPRSREWETLRGSLLLMILGQLLITASIPIDQGFAARLGEGAVATLGYATRIVTLFSGLGTIVLARALLPVLSESVADGDLALGRRHVKQWAWLLGGVAAAGSVVLWFAAPDLVRLLFERGVFTARASAEVASALRWGLVQLPFYFAGIALVQWYAASGRFRAFLGITASAIAVKIALNALLAPTLGVGGIMLSTAGMYGFTLVCLVALLGRGKAAAPLSPRESSR